MSMEQENGIDFYFHNLESLLSDILAEQKNAMEKASRAVADCLKKGGMVYTFGTGHGHLLALEIFYRAGGLAKVCPILDEKLMLHVSAAKSSQEERDETWVKKLLDKYPVGKGDVLFVFSNSGRNAVPVLLAKNCRERGAYVIALTSLSHSRSVTPRNKEHLHLYETADLVLDNGGVPGDASFDAGDGSRVGATSTAVGAAIVQAIMCRVKQICLEEGIEADFFRSANVDGGDAWNEKLIEKYQDQIPGLNG